MNTGTCDISFSRVHMAQMSKLVQIAGHALRLLAARNCQYKHTNSLGIHDHFPQQLYLAAGEKHSSVCQTFI